MRNLCDDGEDVVSVLIGLRCSSDGQNGFNHRDFPFRYPGTLFRRDIGRNQPFVLQYRGVLTAYDLAQIGNFFEENPRLTQNHEYGGEINETWDNYFSGTA